VFKRIVNVIEVLALVAALVAVVALFANDGGSEAAPASTGAAVFAANCARCHGSDGGGGTGPQLSDGKVEKDFPDVADQVEFVKQGKDGMPAFGGQLTAAQINQVVDYTRTL
jgi:cytochrome c oxidase cbb3-type subunit 3